VLLPWECASLGTTELQASIHRIKLPPQPIAHVLAVNFPFGSIRTNAEKRLHGINQHLRLVVGILPFFSI
jgi:hypothetical protein